MERFDMSRTTATTRLFPEDQRRFIINLYNINCVIHVFQHLTVAVLFQYAEDIESGSSDVEAKYKKMYEDDINPFAAFSKKVHMFNISLATLVCMVLHIVYLYFPFHTQEKDQRYKELGLRDKITLSSGRFLLGNKYDTLFFSLRNSDSLPPSVLPLLQFFHPVC